jgi:methyl-accepting chemotaxis protein
MKGINLVSIFVRVTSAFGLVLLIAAIAISLLSYEYFGALVARDQAVKISFDAQQTANLEQVNLERMNAQLQTRFAQVFATQGGPIQDPALQASGALISVDLLTREDEFAQTLLAYQQQFVLATSPDMREVRAIVESDDPASSIGREQAQALARVTQTEWPRYKRLQDQVVQLLDPTTDPLLVSDPRRSYVQAYTALFAANQQFLFLKLDWQQVVHSAQAIGEIVTNVGRSQIQPVVISTSLALGFTILIILLTSYIVNLTITRPLRALAHLTRRISRGETQVRVPVEGRDEIALVASSMNGMLDKIVTLMHQAQFRHENLQRHIMKLIEEVSGTARGDLRVQASVDSPELGTLADAINSMVEELSSLVVRVKRVAYEVVRVTLQMARYIQHLVESTEHHIAQIRTAALDVERMAQASQRVAERTQALATVAEAARAAAEEGAGAVERTREGMERIHENVLSTAQQIKGLEALSATISEITSVMIGIGQRIERLALDAAIQSAMAGEHGKGFGAVAADIRRLAEGTKEQTRTIARTVQRVRTEIEGTAKVMRETTREAESGIHLAQQLRQALEALFAAVEQQADEIVRINQVAREQVQVSALVVETIQGVSASTQRSNVETRQGVRYLHHAVALVQQLRSSVEVFQVREEIAGVPGRQKGREEAAWSTGDDAVSPGSGSLGPAPTPSLGPPRSPLRSARQP